VPYSHHQVTIRMTRLKSQSSPPRLVKAQWHPQCPTMAVDCLFHGNPYSVLESKSTHKAT
jgi:hypothetical protein